MANVRDSDTCLWLHNKLGTSNDSWTGGSICSQLNAEVLRNIKDCFPDLQTQVKLKLLLSFFHIPRRNVEEWRLELEEIIEVAALDSELWVAMLAETMKTFPATGSLNTEISDLDDVRPIFTDLVNDLKKLVKKQSENCLLPMECHYLNKAALVSVVGQQPAPSKHFNQKKKPKSALLRAELLQKSSDAASNLKKASAPVIPVRSRGMPRKMTDTTPLKGIPSRVPSSGFRGGILINPTVGGRPLPRTPAGRKDGGIKLLDIADQPLGYAAAKKRKRLQELEDAKKSTEQPGTIQSPTTITTTTTTATTTTTTLASGTTPDYAVGLSSTTSYAPNTPQHTSAAAASSLTRETLAQSTNVSSAKSSAMSNITTAPYTSTTLTVTTATTATTTIITTQTNATIPVTTYTPTPATKIISTPVILSTSAHNVQLNETVLAGSVNNNITATTVTEQQQYPNNKTTIITTAATLASAQSVTITAAATATITTTKTASDSTMSTGLVGTNTTPSGGVAASVVVARPIQQFTQIRLQPQPVGNTLQKKGLALTREQMLEAQDMFRTANKVTRPEKALILGFMAGSRDNPCPHLGNIVTIKLSEDQENVLQADDTYLTMMVETHFQMNYNNGEWKRIKKFRPIENIDQQQQQQQQQVPVQTANNQSSATAIL